jgi:2-polyprenyl-3-methyl-5-hydroxy-6-metoxy-1,4-benzoquinol methylase
MSYPVEVALDDDRRLVMELRRGAELYGNALDSPKGRRRVLDVACGPGLLMQELQKAGADLVVGLDTRPVYLHDASLGPCYVRFLATMGRHNSPED